MTDASDANPYEPSGAAGELRVGEKTPRRWPAIVVLVAAIYYLTSAATFPLASRVWIGEVPILALFQFPKAVLRSLVHETALDAMRTLDLSYGSPSPDSIAVSPWSMGVTLVAPAMALIAGLSLIPRVRRRGVLIAAVIICATLDGIVTWWVDAASRTDFFSGVYF